MSRNATSKRAGSRRGTFSPQNGGAPVTEIVSGRLVPESSSQNQGRIEMKKTLKVMKFGGTSVGDACCIAKVVEIIRRASHESDVVVVVSAMSGVTNKLVQAASEAAAGNGKAVAGIFKQLRQQHDVALRALIQSPEQQRRICRKMDALLEEGERLCQGTLLLQELTAKACDAISSLGERLLVPLLAATLIEHGVASEAIEATELVVTDSSHGAAEPWLDLTRERCESRLLSLVKQGIVPVVTGFIGATREGALTTLGRGGSDYSATILGAALEADEVVIWTDVDGLLTADPRLVPGARIIPEISYREAAELAYFGAKVLHPKTMRPVVQRRIPLWIRNTFAPENAGTKISATGAGSIGAVAAITAVSEAALIMVGGAGIAGVPDVLGRTLAATRELRTDVLLISHSSSQNDVCLVVASNAAKHTVEGLRREFAQDLAHENADYIALDSNVAIVSVVGKSLRGVPGLVVRTLSALGRENIETIAMAHGASDSNISFVVAKKDVKTALIATHRELRLGMLNPSIPPESVIGNQSNGLVDEAERYSATAD